MFRARVELKFQSFTLFTDQSQSERESLKEICNKHAKLLTVSLRFSDLAEIAALSE